MNVTAPIPLESSFLKDLDDIALGLITKFELPYKKEEAHLSSPVMRWMDFRHRYVDPMPRPVVYSDKFPIAALHADTESAVDAAKGLAQLVKLFEEGGDVNPYQGRGLKRKNDTSGSAGHQRTDLLYADWDLLHFHLTVKPQPPGQYFSAPGDYLAFCLVANNAVAFVDVLRHPDREGFANVELFETMVRNWPEHMEQYKIRGILASRATLTTHEISNLREKGVGTMYPYQGAMYMSPGMGVTSASTPVRLTLACDHIYGWVRALAAMVAEPRGQIRTHPAVAAVPDPQFNLGMGASGLVIREMVSSTDFDLPGAAPDAQRSWLRDLNESFAPAWAALELVK